MKNITYSLLIATVSSLSLTQVAQAAALYTKKVFCGKDECGTMNINKYETYRDATLGGVTIEGKFDAKKNVTFHYIQASIVNDAPLAFLDGTNTPVPFIDTPPGGYQGQPFDLLPYYDEKGEYPDFYDQPKKTLSKATDPNIIKGDGRLDVKFETWLVCSISEMLGKDKTKATDDTFKVAPLLGWTWGYNIKPPPVSTRSLLSQSALSLEGTPSPIVAAGDYSVTAEPFQWLLTGTPSAQWTTALAQEYGNASKRDKFNVQIGACKDCTLIPEPSSVLGLLAFGTLGAASALKRKQNQKSAEKETTKVG